MKYLFLGLFFGEIVFYIYGKGRPKRAGLLISIRYFF